MFRASILAASLLALAASPSFAADEKTDFGAGMYVSVWGGVTLPGAITGNYYGSTTVELNSKTGYTLGGAIGHTLWNDDVRGEIEVSHQSNDIDDANVGWQDNEDCTDQTCRVIGSSSFTYVMANIWFDMPLTGMFTPYFGGGVGMALFSPDIAGEGTIGGFLDESSDPYDNTSLGAAAQLGLGVKTTLTEIFLMDVGYRLKGVTGFTVGNEIDGDNGCYPCSLSSAWTYSHTLQAGLTFGF
jgi:opacity protein-like surface antigen